jgi:undecaprenyl-diphosphatase
VLALNRSIFDWINHWPEGLAPTMKFFSEAATYGWFKALLGLMVLGMVIRGAKSRWTAVQALIAFPLANGLTDVFKHLLPENRPFVDLPSSVILRIGHMPEALQNPSFGTASAHSANMAAVAFVFTYRLGWWGAPWILVALVTGLSRIYNGVHYPYQVLLGWTCGVLMALLVTKTWDGVAKGRSGVNVDRAQGAEMMSDE